MSLLKNCCDFRQRAVALVDNIFAQKTKKGSAQESIEKLIYYATSSPEKLNRISARLHYHLTLFCKSNRAEYILLLSSFVHLVFEVVNQLLDQSSSSFKNLMMDDYFRMLLRLLDSNVHDFKILASKSVFYTVKVSKICQH
ncbi:Protein EFR3 B [Thelohanellus kitauei]|uniref:Protein EFR3 B n=1 Tax=Thelohanellus kitauei TaxID=669202 RepID=A0A0C2MRX9_THEKT|nr:Protein EFR3 B [Thelohanellus kitauei]